jgi:glutamate racemase
VPDDRPIGIFDSGVGGMTVVRAVLDDLPHESIVYFGDNGRFPYGPRPLDEIREFAVQIAEYLVTRDVKLIVAACNAATSAGLDQVIDAVPVPVVGVIEPAVRSAVRATRNGRVGLIGTQATVESGAYLRAFERLGPAVAVTSQPCPRFVEFVERGDTTSPDLLRVASDYLAPVQEAGVDTLILGCTHYPFLRAAIHFVMGPDVLLLSSAEETANDVYELLAVKDLLAGDQAPPTHRFETSGDREWFATLGARFLGPEVRSADRVVLDPAGSR